MAHAKDIAARSFTSLHRTIYLASKGRLLANGLGMPVLALTTTGRKTGRRRTTMLTSPVQDGERLVLVASNGGDDRSPKWLLNLREEPAVDVTMGGTTRAMRARVASPEGKADLWPRVVAAYKGYARYQTRTDRDIPLVILEP